MVLSNLFSESEQLLMLSGAVYIDANVSPFNELVANTDCGINLITVTTSAYSFTTIGFIC